MTKHQIITMISLISASCLSCMTNHQSNWQALKSVDSIDCQEWPIEDNEVQVSSIFAVKGQKPGFLVSSLLNTSRDQHYFVPFSQSTKLDKNKKVPLVFNKNMQILGSGVYKGTVAAVLLADDSKKGRILEIRDVNKNTVLEALPLNNRDSTGGQALIDGDKLWISLYDGQYWLAAMDTSSKKNKTEFFSKPLSTEPLLLKPQKDVFFSVIQEIKQDDLTEFKLARLDQGKSHVDDIPIQSKNDVEGWDAAIADDESLVLTYVAGDSLVGRAQLVVERFTVKDRSIEALSRLQTDLDGSHISNPVINGEKIFAIRWLDGESLLSVYERSQEGQGLVEQRFGPLPEAASIADVLKSENGDDFVLVRYKQDTDEQIKYSLCEID